MGRFEQLEHLRVSREESCSGSQRLRQAVVAGDRAVVTGGSALR